MSSLVIMPEKPPNEAAGDQSHLKSLLAQVTFGQCQAQCLASIECRAFSFCIRFGQSECVLTRANFRAGELSSRLESLDLTRLKSDSPIKLEALHDKEGNQANEGSLELRKHPTCELHLKSYIGLFERGLSIRQREQLQGLEPVSDREQCARMCFEATLKSLADDGASAKWAISSEALDKLHGDDPKLRHLLDQHNKAGANVCLAFVYLEPADNSASAVSKLKALNAAKSVGEHQPTTEGYCRLKRFRESDGAPPVPKKPSRSDGDDGDGQSGDFEDLQLEFHEMDFNFMFTKRHGISLKRSVLSQDEEHAFSMIHLRDEGFEPTELDYQLAREFIERGDNAVIQIGVHDLDLCAKYCFLQIMPAWLACKSFGVVEEVVPFSAGSGQHLIRYTCHLNSVTLRETHLKGRNDLIESRPSAAAADASNNRSSTHDAVEQHHWHYEPKGSPVGHFIDWNAKVQFEHDFWRARVPAGRQTIRIHPLWLLGFLLATLLLGFHMGLKAGDRILSSRTTNYDDREDLVGALESGGRSDMFEQPGLEFRNLANYQQAEEDEVEVQAEGRLRAC